MKLPPFRLERYFARYEFHAPYLLGCSDCESMTTGELLDLEDGAEAALRALRLGYTESAGGPGLRREIGKLYADPSPRRVLAFSGAEEAILAFMSVAIEPGARIVVPFPCYQSLHEIARARGCDVVLWKAREERGAWRFDVDELARLVDARTRAVVVNFPHNPTGAHASRFELERVRDICARVGAYLFSDEVYRGLEHDDRDRLPAGCDLYERGVSLGVMSKSYGLAGLRIGWIVTPDAKLYDAMASFKDYTTICNSAPSELLAELALRRSEGILRRNRELVAANLAKLDAFFSRHAETFAWSRPRAGCLAMPRVTRPEGADAFCRALVEKAGVLLVPGSLFEVPGDAHVRLGFGRATLSAGLEKVEAFLEGTAR